MIWMTMGEIDIVATAQGKIVPNDRSKTIQPLEAATVKAIRVADGEKVKAGQVLIELDPTTAQADKDRIAGDLGVVRLQVVRANAMLAALSSGKSPIQDRPSLVVETKWMESQRLLQGQYDEFVAKSDRLDAEIAKCEAERCSTLELLRKLEKTVPIAQQRAAGGKYLANKAFLSEDDYLAREQTRIEQEADLAVQRSKLKEIGATLREAKGQKTELAAETRRINLDGINDGVQKAFALEQELLKAETRGKLMKLVAPVDGTVQQLVVHTIGGVVTPAQPVMTIVPSGDSLEIEAFLENKDIGFVRSGQRAEVKIETFQYTKYGTIRAEVTSVSHDAISDEKRGLIYSSRVKMERTRINVDGTEVNLSPGMAVTVEVKTGKRRVVEYLLTPLIQRTSESLRER
ncbi:MAG TPA: hemolysin secretion protein D [Cyanobacteria bacterium UBA8530]|nr:hemolysin secretion protein D [Cyanobacteria bacterium UBA8530]